MQNAINNANNINATAPPTAPPMIASSGNELLLSVTITIGGDVVGANDDDMEVLASESAADGNETGTVVVVVVVAVEVVVVGVAVEAVVVGIAVKVVVAAVDNALVRVTLVKRAVVAVDCVDLVVFAIVLVLVFAIPDVSGAGVVVLGLNDDVVVAGDGVSASVVVDLVDVVCAGKESVGADVDVDGVVVVFDAANAFGHKLFLNLRQQPPRHDVKQFVSVS